MDLIETGIEGLFEVVGRRAVDERGWFQVLWEGSPEFATVFGSEAVFAQAWNPHVHTLRGLHYQVEPSTQWKLVTCLQGAVFDVVVDPRPCSDTFRQHREFELSFATGRSLIVGPGLAHGYLTLKANSLVVYLLSQGEDLGAARGLNYLDPAFSIVWPADPEVVSQRDASFEFLRV